MPILLLASPAQTLYLLQHRRLIPNLSPSILPCRCIWVILGYFGLFWAILGYSGLLFDVLLFCCTERPCQVHRALGPGATGATAHPVRRQQRLQETGPERAQQGRPQNQIGKQRCCHHPNTTTTQHPRTTSTTSTTSTPSTPSTPSTIRHPQHPTPAPNTAPPKTTPPWPTV